ncbi:MAG TPA: CapA family protein [Candidatus Limnocylindrales bacterium]|nr:CapA family protein [Candidatus Limnocylindrales bacterium]
MKRLPLLTVLALLAVAVVFTVAGSLNGPVAPSGGPAASGSGGIVAGATSSPSVPATPAATASPAPTPTPTPTTVPIVDVPIVAVTQFRTTLERTGFEEVRAVLAGSSETFEALELVETEADAILATLGAERPSDPERLVLAADASTLMTDLASNRKRLAFLRATDVGPGVRALGWGDRRLFGVGAVETVEAWGLTARLPEPGPAFDPAASWTLVAGGDILLDRGVAQTVKVNRKGVDFPFDGGTADITSRYCCSSFGWNLPRTKRTGGDGAMRALLQGADLAIANFENPAPNRFRYHTSGTVFSADPALIEGLANAGLDWVSLANNHIGDAGRTGIVETIDNLAEFGIAAGGAGRNARAARRPSILEAGGTKVGILAYDTIAPGYRAGAEKPGSASLSAQIVAEDVVKARDAGAEVIVVFPHWGTEYDPTPFAAQQELARACIDAGADVVIGNHAHWAGAVETYEDKPIWYALGNFVFDQTWSEPTMEGVTLELTFRGAELVQARMRPHIILDKAQPNFLDPAGDGRVVMGQIFDASEGLLDW